MCKGGQMGGPAITRRRLLIGMGAVGALAVAGGGVTNRGAPAGAVDGPLVRVDPATRLGRLGARALGFSFERSTLPLPLFDDANTDLAALFRLLGPGLLRIGAKTVDTTGWEPTGPGRTAGVVAPADLAALRRFADAVDWEVLHGLPFVHPDSSPGAAADEAGVVAATLGEHLAAYEFGNEPDLYAFDPTAAPLAGTLDQCRTLWETFAAAVQDVDPATPLTGPGCCLLQTLDSYSVPFVEAEAGSLGLVTQHYYRGFGGGGQTIDLLLGPDPLLASSLATLAGATAAAGATGFRLTETNSFASGGQPGVSNTFASALWAVGLMLDTTAAGADGCNFHNSGAGAGYPAIVQVDGTVTEVRPLFYGLLFLASLGQATHLASTSTGVPSSLRVHPLVGDDGDFRVVLSNLDAASPITVDIDLATPIMTGSVAHLVASSLDATSGVTCRGAPVGIDGAWEPLGDDDLVVSGSTLSVTVGPASAAVVRARPAPPLSTSTSTSEVAPTTAVASTTVTTTVVGSGPSSTGPAPTSTTPGTSYPPSSTSTNPPTTATRSPSSTTTRGGDTGRATGPTPAIPTVAAPSYTG